MTRPDNHKTRHDKTKQDRTGHDKTRQGIARPDTTS